MRRAWVMVPGLLLLPVMTLPAPPPAAADEPAPYPDLLALSLPRVTDIEADPTRERAFVAGGGNSDHVEIVSSAGESLGSVPIQHPQDLLLSPDGATMYVAVARDPARIDAIDLETLEVSTVAVVDGDGPTMAHDLAWAAGMVWATVDVDSHRRIVAVDPDSGATTSFARPGLDPSIDSSPARPDMLVVGDAPTLWRYRVTGGSSPTFVEQARRDLEDGFDEVALSPDGRRLVTMAHNYYDAQAYRAGDLSDVDSWSVQGFVDDVEFRADGQTAISSGDEVSVFGAGHTSFAARYAVPEDQRYLETAPGGLAWGDDELYSVLVDSYDGNPQLAVLPADAPDANPVTNGVQGSFFHRILAVPGTGRAFLTQGRNGNGVFVLDRSGRITQVIEHLPGAEEMTLDADGSTLYVALNRADAVAAIDTRTLRVRRIPTGTDSCPSSVAVTGRRLWFTGTCSWVNGPLGAIDLDTQRVRFPVGDVSATLLTSSPSRPHILWAGGFDWVAGEVMKLRVSRSGPPSVRLLSQVAAGPAQTDQVLTPDGLHLLPATPGAEVHPVLDARTLRLVGAADTQFNPVATAVRSDGLFAAGVADHFSDGWLNDPVQGWTIRVFDTALGRQVVHRKGLYLSRGAWVSPRGLAFGRRDLYAVHEDIDGDLRVVSRRMPPVRALTLTADRAAYESGNRARLVAHVTTGRRVVRIHRVTDSGRTLVERGPTDRFGNLDARLRVRPGQRYVATMGGHRSGLVIEGTDDR
jgi:DNA-binding beta-propeller fold protein YncE